MRAFHRTTKLTAALAIAALVHVFAAPAAAQSSHDDEARVLFQAGQMAFTDGRYEDALEYFERSFALSGRPALLYNIGTTADRLRLEERALEAFQGYIDALPQAENRKEVEARMRILERSIAERQARPAEPEPVTPVVAPEPAQAEPDVPPGAQNLEATGLPQSDEGKKKLVQKGWFWAVIGVAAFGLGLGISAAAINSAEKQFKALEPGDDGNVIYTLTFGH